MSTSAYGATPLRSPSYATTASYSTTAPRRSFTSRGSNCNSHKKISGDSFFSSWRSSGRSKRVKKHCYRFGFYIIPQGGPYARGKDFVDIKLDNCIRILLTTGQHAATGAAHQPSETFSTTIRTSLYTCITHTERIPSSRLGPVRVVNNMFDRRPVLPDLDWIFTTLLNAFQAGEHRKLTTWPAGATADRSTRSPWSASAWAAAARRCGARRRRASRFVRWAATCRRGTAGRCSSRGARSPPSWLQTEGRRLTELPRANASCAQHDFICASVPTVVSR